MLTPKEKAQELVDKFYNEVPKLGVIIERDRKAYNSSKQCALIAVDEILKIVPSIYLTEDEEVHSGHYQYWQQVKTEIENL